MAYQGKRFDFRLNPDNGEVEKQLFNKLNSLENRDRSEFIRSLMIQSWLLRNNFKK